MASEQPRERPSMQELKERYIPHVIKGLKKERLWEEIFKIATENSVGQLCLIGGGVYRSIIEGEYKTKTDRENKVIDLDFVASQLSTEPYSPRNFGWSERRTKYGNPSYWKGKHCVVLNDLNTFHSIVASGNQPSLEKLLDLTPLDIQAIGLIINKENLFDGELIGDKGILAIYNRQVRINNLSESTYEVCRELAYEAQLVIGSPEFQAHIEKVDINQLLKEFVGRKARQLGFNPDFTLHPE